MGKACFLGMIALNCELGQMKRSGKRSEASSFLSIHRIIGWLGLERTTSIHPPTHSFTHPFTSPERLGVIGVASTLWAAVLFLWLGVHPAIGYKQCCSEDSVLTFCNCGPLKRNRKTLSSSSCL